MGTVVCVITKSVILISAQFNISQHYSFMVQNQITVSPCLSLAVKPPLHLLQLKKCLKAAT